MIDKDLLRIEFLNCQQVLQKYISTKLKPLLNDPESLLHSKKLSLFVKTVARQQDLYNKLSKMLNEEV